jgi:hypothetical protein
VSARESQQLVTIPVAAERLNVGVATVRRMLRAGAPQARRGRRGRGGAALLHVDSIRAWKAARNGTGDSTAALEAFAAQIPEVVADEMWRVFLLCRDKPLDRRTLPGAFAALWYAIAKALRDRIAIEAPTVADITETPAQIDQLLRYLDPTR